MLEFHAGQPGSALLRDTVVKNPQWSIGRNHRDTHSVVSISHACSGLPNGWFRVWESTCLAGVKRATPQQRKECPRERQQILSKAWFNGNCLRLPSQMVLMDQLRRWYGSKNKDNSMSMRYTHLTITFVFSSLQSCGSLYPPHTDKKKHTKKKKYAALRGWAWSAAQHAEAAHGTVLNRRVDKERRWLRLT